MTNLIFSNAGVDKTVRIECAPQKVFEIIDKILPSLETQLCTSIDLIAKDDNVTLLCDGVNPRILAFIELICNKEIAKRT